MNDSEFYSLLERKEKGESFTSIRNELKAKGYTEVEIQKTIKEIDGELVSKIPTRKSVSPRMLAGFITGLIGVVLLAIGFRGIVIYCVILSGLMQIAVRLPKRNKSRIQSKWERR